MKKRRMRIMYSIIRIQCLHYIFFFLISSYFHFLLFLYFCHFYYFLFFIIYFSIFIFLIFLEFFFNRNVITSIIIKNPMKEVEKIKFGFFLQHGEKKRRDEQCKNKLFFKRTACAFAIIGINYTFLHFPDLELAILAYADFSRIKRGSGKRVTKCKQAQVDF